VDQEGGRGALHNFHVGGGNHLLHQPLFLELFQFRGDRIEFFQGRKIEEIAALFRDHGQDEHGLPAKKVSGLFVLGHDGVVLGKHFGVIGLKADAGKKEAKYQRNPRKD
jgi:hypothetical protein